MIEITGLKKSFGQTVACDIPSLKVGSGELLGLVGNNGAGKTTLFRLMLDLLKPDAGEVSIEGTNPSESEEWKAITAAFIDEGFLIDFLTPEEYFAFIGKVCGLSQATIGERLRPLEHFSGGEVTGQKKLIRNLSAGNKQKVGIMAALLQKPRLLVLDEPFNFLDPSSQVVLKHILTDYARQTGATILLSSHNLQHTVDISTRIVLLEKGCVHSDFASIDELAKAQLSQYFGEGKPQEDAGSEKEVKAEQ